HQYHCADAPGVTRLRAMLRRHAFGFRTLLMITDGLLALALLAVVSYVRFGPEWFATWSSLLDQPVILALDYAAGWSGVLCYYGLYRPRARWPVRGEAVAIARAAFVMAVISAAVLFAVKVSDVSRLFLVFLFPTQWLLTLGTRIA